MTIVLFQSDHAEVSLASDFLAVLSQQSWLETFAERSGVLSRDEMLACMHVTARV